MRSGVPGVRVRGKALFISGVTKIDLAKIYFAFLGTNDVTSKL
jgi:hypothetical protein